MFEIVFDIVFDIVLTFVDFLFTIIRDVEGYGECWGGYKLWLFRSLCDKYDVYSSGTFKILIT